MQQLSWNSSDLHFSPGLGLSLACETRGKLPIINVWLPCQNPPFLGIVQFSILCAVPNAQYQWKIYCTLVTPAPGMMHIMDRPGSCGNFDTYQRPEGFPVGTFPFPQPLKALSMNKVICENVHSVKIIIRFRSRGPSLGQRETKERQPQPQWVYAWTYCCVF